MGFNYKKHMYRTRQNSAFDQPERWFCGMFLGQSWPGVSISQHIWAIISSFQVSHGFFQLWWVLKLQSQNFVPGKLTAPYVDRTFGFPISEMRTFRYALRKNMVSLNFSLSKIWSLEPPAIQPWWGMFFPAAGKPWHCRGHGPCGILAPCCAGGQ